MCQRERETLSCKKSIRKEKKSDEVYFVGIWKEGSPLVSNMVDTQSVLTYTWLLLLHKHMAIA